MTVYLVGAGPGDPGLLTVRGAEVLRRADVVIHDRLAGSALLDLAPALAERISVGKTPRSPSGAGSGERSPSGAGSGERSPSGAGSGDRSPSTPQEEINRLLVDHGGAGREVVRLKGGDPFVFARGGEEVAALAAAGIAFEIVPGVTSAIAVPAYAGVPLTYRGLSTSFTVVTGHEDPWAATETDWEAVARVGGTIVVLMGVATRAAIAERLLAGGLDSSTPVAAITWGTRPEQHTVRTTLAALGETHMESPAVIVIGAVAGLDLGWFERRPLFGRRVAVTGGRIANRLREAGADVVEAIAIGIADPADGGAALRDAAARVRDNDWVLFTSVNAVDRLVPLLRDSRAFGDTKIAAIGEATAAALARWHVVADVVAEQAVGEGLLDALPDGPCRALLPRAASARDVVPDGLRARGWTVEVVEAYRTVPLTPAAVDADAITFLSPSAVDAYVDANGTEHVPAVVACIGPVTAARARERGLDVAIESAPGDASGLVTALATRLRR